MVKTRSNTSTEVENNEETESPITLKQILAEIRTMRREIDEINGKINTDNRKTTPPDTPEKSGPIKSPRTPLPENSRTLDSEDKSVDKTSKITNTLSFFTAVELTDVRKDQSMHLQEARTQNNQITVVRGEAAFYKSQLRTVLDLHDVITHLTNFNDWRRRLSSQQLLITTLHRNALIELDLGLLAGSDNMGDHQLLRFIKVYWHATPPSRTEFLKMIEKIQLEEMDLQTKNNDNQAIIQNYRIMNTYLADINRFALAFKELTGIEYQDNIINKRNVSAEYPYSTIWQIAESKLSVIAPSWLEMITYEMNFKEFKTWKTVYQKIQEKSEEVMLIYRQHATIFNGIKGMLRPPRSPQVPKQPDRNQTYTSSQNIINKSSPSPTRRLFPKLASIQDSPTMKPTTQNKAVEQEEGDNSDDDYNRDQTPTNIPVEDGSQIETEHLNEEELAELYALGLSNDKTDDRVCYRWLTSQCDLGNKCALPHSTSAAERHIQKLKLAIDKKKIPNLASIGNGTEGMRTTAWLDLEDGEKPHEIQVLLDPGSDVYSFISSDLVKNLFMDTSQKEDAATIRLGGTEHTKQTEGAIWINITIEQVTATILMHIFDTKEDVIIGLPHIRQHFIQPTVNLLVQNRQTPLNFVTALDPIASMAALSHEDIEAELVRLMEQQEK
jgi:hypothetical protein